MHLPRVLFSNDKLQDAAVTHLSVVPSRQLLQRVSCRPEANRIIYDTHPDLMGSMTVSGFCRSDPSFPHHPTRKEEMLDNKRGKRDRGPPAHFDPGPIAGRPIPEDMHRRHLQNPSQKYIQAFSEVSAFNPGIGYEAERLFFSL